MVNPIINNKEALTGQAGIHALIIGVSEYTHLPAMDAIQGDPLFDMKRLSSPALSAYRFYRWLVDRDWNGPGAGEVDGRLVLPIKTCRLLLSPSPKELEVEPALAKQNLVPSASFSNFKAAAIDWRKDASSGPDSPHDMTVFYFSGHGLWSTPTETILAAADFLEPPTATPLERCVAFQNLKKGLAPQKMLRNISLTQLYFIDCCRNFPPYLSAVSEAKVGEIFDIKVNDKDLRELSIYYSTVPGKFAIGIDGKESIFCEALLDALTKAVDKERAFNDGIWAVTTDHVKRAIEHYLKCKYQISDDLPPEAIASTTSICFLKGPPDIDLTIDIIPPAARAGAKVKLCGLDDGMTYPVSLDAKHSVLFRSRVPMGIYELTVQPAKNFYTLYSKKQFVQYDVLLPWLATLAPL